jgi:hypothetical protein
MVSRRLPLGRDEFANGLAQYADNTPDRSHQRSYIVIPVVLGGFLPTWAIVDTGAEYCVIHPHQAEQLPITYFMEGRRLIGGGDYDGRYGYLNIGIDADEGESISVETTVWVPRLRYGQVWPHPNLIGLTGFLEKVRFAVDPEYNQFYFGAFGENSA